MAKGEDQAREDGVTTIRGVPLLDGLSTPAHCRVGRIGATPVAFVASLMAVGVKEAGLLHSEGRLARREHRLVVRPEWQGLGIGPRVSDINARDWVLKGVRFLSRTAHPRFGAYRNNSPLWQATTPARRRTWATRSRDEEKKGKEVKKIEKARPSTSHVHRRRRGKRGEGGERSDWRRRRRRRRRHRGGRRRRVGDQGGGEEEGGGGHLQDLDLLRGRRQLDRGPPLHAAAGGPRGGAGSAVQSVPFGGGARAAASAGAAADAQRAGEAQHVHVPGVLGRRDTCARREGRCPRQRPPPRR